MRVFVTVGLLIGLWASLALEHAAAQLKAFPEAEGFGAYTTGARANLSSASVYHVTNLNDSGPGSFRDAVSQSNRFVVFDVGGIINIDSVVTVARNTTIAGQTAPGGISLYNNRISFTSSDNLISRHFGVHMGTAPGRVDAASIARGQDMIFDHMSITWGIDGTFDINPDSGYVIDNITIQNTIVGQGLDVVGHSTGGLMTPGSGGSISVIKSLYADNVTRNPKVRYENEFINNVVYGWESNGYIMGDTTGADSYANVVGNYFIEGPIDGGGPFNSGTSYFHIYADDNWVDTDRDGVLDGSLVTSYPGADVVGTPHAFPTTATMTAQQAVAHVIENVGCSIIRDAVDTRLVEEIASYGTLGGVIERESDLFPGYGSDPIYLNPRARFTDSDNDGIADNWESANGLSSSNANDWKNLSGAGYTWLEEYVNELGADGTTTTSLGGAWTSAGSWANGVPTLADDAVAYGSLSHASGNAFARRLSLSGNLNVTGGTVDVFDTATVGSGAVSVSSGNVTAGRMLVASAGQTVSIALQSGATLQSGTVAANGGTASLSIDGATFRATGTADISIPTTLGAGGGTIDTNGYDAQVSATVTGSGGLTKQGSGNLLLDATASFSGPLSIQQGTVELGSSASVGNASSIELAQGTTLDVSAVGSLTLGSGQTLTGQGTLTGNLTAVTGSVVEPLGEMTGQVYTIGIQAEDMNLSSDWAIFDNDVHGTGNGGSYDGSGLFGDGIVMVDNQSLTEALASGIISTSVDVPYWGNWYLFVRSAEPSVSVIPGDPATPAAGNNSLWVSGISGTVTTSIVNYEEAQTPSNAPDSAKWVKLSPTLDALSGVWGAENDGIDYSLASGTHTFAVGGREVGTILDGFVLTTANLNTYQLDAALNGSSGFYDGQSLTVDGNFTQLPGSTLAIEIDGADSFNKLDVTGSVTLAGMLDVTLSGYAPQEGDVFEILSADGGLSGTFSGGVSLPDLSGTLQWDVIYDTITNRVLLEVITPAYTADFDGDGDVDNWDLVWWHLAFGVDDQADADGDGDSDGADFLLWQRQYTGDLASASPASGAVPEPNSLALVVMAAVGMLLRRR